MNNIKQLKKDFSIFIQQGNIQEIINEKDFYFDELKILFQEFLKLDISSITDEINDFLKPNDSKFIYQDILDKHQGTDFGNLLLLIGKMISIFDEKGYNKHLWNPYTDKRVVSRSNFSQKSWSTCFLLYKLDNNGYSLLIDRADRTIINAIEYIISPNSKLPITSGNHKLLLFEYFNLDNDKSIIDLFETEFSSISNENNKSICLTYFLYSNEIKRDWQISIQALLIADGTGWQEEHIEISKKSKYNIVWNSKRPSGTNDTISKLNEKLNQEGCFYLYYSSKGIVKYRAKIIDFVTNENEHFKKNWKNIGSVYGLEEKFEDYHDLNKSAAIVFLIEIIEKIEPISISNFICYKNYKHPTQDNIAPISEIQITIKKLNIIKDMSTLPLNQILYGPPGTGKTYTTVDIVSNIIEPDNKLTRKEKKNLFDKLLNDKRVYFTTFHQSMSYEEFIEGIKPITVKDQVHYNITDGIFKSICEQCLDEIKELKNQNAPKNEANLTFKEKFEEFVLAIQKGIVEIKTRSGIEVNLSKVSPSGNIRLITGTDTRDYIISANRLEKLYNAFPNPSLIVNIHDEIRNVIGGSHTSLYYASLEAFVKFNDEIQKSVHIEGKELELKDIKLTEEEIQSLPPYFLVIDEINRGNVSSIFGELITLLEEDKRFGKENQLFIKLPYSKEDFIVPPNLYIIGTMNTADRSVEALDTALRRRFSFVEMLPEPQLLSPLAVCTRFYNKNYSEVHVTKLFDFLGVNQNFSNSEISGLSLLHDLVDDKEKKELDLIVFNGVHLNKLLSIMNERIELLIDRDHTIGHAYFMDVFDIERLKFAFQNKIIPLLQEYFYGNYTKMEMVIGSYFFEELKNKKVKFATVNNDFDDLPRQYKLKNVLSEEFNMMDAIVCLYNEKKDNYQSDTE